MPLIYLEVFIQADIQIVFDLSRSIDLHKISTKQTNEEAIAGVTSGLINLNETVTWRAKHFGVYQNLTSKITEFKNPSFFVDEMQEGIFKSIRHEHHFGSKNNGTLMKDYFYFESPLGVLGKLANILFLKNYLKKLLTERNDIIKEYAENSKHKLILNINNEELLTNAKRPTN